MSRFRFALVVVAALTLWAWPAQAGLESYSGDLASATARDAGVGGMVKNADQAAAELLVTCGKFSDQQGCLEDVDTTVHEIERQAGGNAAITATLLVLDSSGGGARKSWGDGGAVGAILLTAKLDAADDVYRAATRISRFVNSLKLSKKMSLHLAPVSLGMADPEQYKDALLKAARERIEAVRKIVGDSVVVEMPNLEARVAVAAVNARQVRLWIPWTMTYREPKPATK